MSLTSSEEVRSGVSFWDALGRGSPSGLRQTCLTRCMDRYLEACEYRPKEVGPKFD